MRIILNGQTKELPGEMTVQELLALVEMDKPYVAVSVNMTCIPRSTFSQTRVQSGDEIEVLTPYQGG